MLCKVARVGNQFSAVDADRCFWHNRSTGPVLQLQLHLWLANSSLKLWPTGEINVLRNICILYAKQVRVHQSPVASLLVAVLLILILEFRNILGSRIAQLSTTVSALF